MPDHPDWTKGNIFQKFTPHEVVYISLYDIGLVYNKYSKQLVIGRLEPHVNLHSSASSMLRPEVRKFFGFGDPKFNSGIWAAYLDGCFGDTESKFQRLPDTFKRRFKQLIPQLVDLDVRHRILFVQRCSRSTVKAFIYMWHRQSIDTFDAHFRNISIFADTVDETWISTVTISYWQFKVRTNSTSDTFFEPRDTAPFPPKAVSSSHSFKSNKGSNKDIPANSPKNKIKHIIEGSSSVVISGDPRGRWWTCSIVSSILPTSVMKHAAVNTTGLLREFAHQTFSGRCIVFLSFLGVLCVHIAIQYEEILEELTRAINLGREVLKNGLDWTHAEDAIQRLKSMLWALEALRIFDDRLGDSLEVVKNAEDRMRAFIRRGPGRRHDQLEHHCNMLLEAFDRDHGRLISVRVKIEQKINQISRYREGISAVSNLEDTHTALKQNDTIRILTYVTIAYLPLSFIAAVFSMSIVTESNWGPSLFGGLIVIFFVSTLVLAKSLGLIIQTWDSLVKTIRLKLGISDPLDLEEIMDQAEEEFENEKQSSESEEEDRADDTAAKARRGPMAFVRNLRHRKNVARKDSVDSLP
ncbi:hypothetical protein VTL71DRAFT_3678 [Oculimacula yallundae]|uniref:Uncharacterized protein n=1 Tax=Oculimacula yallundae TaxID=86028 RepID=A0ABR4C3N2_9HELO